MDFLQELQQKAQRYDPIVKGADCWIKCPFHGGGQERTQSCRINLTKNSKYPAGYFYCYGCGKFGNWNELAQGIPNLELLSDEEVKHQDLVIAKLTAAQKSALLGFDESEIVNFSTMVDWNPKKIWRKIDGQLLHDIGAKKFFNKSFQSNQIFLPAYQNNNLKGGIKAILERMAHETAYFNTSGPWVKKTLFPYDYVKKFMKTRGNIVALVEGPRDALNMIQNGFPALAILGSKNWSTFKANLTLLLDPSLIVLAFDADEAGESATASVLNTFTDKSNIIQLKFKDGQDPGALTKEEVEKYYQKCLKIVNK